LTYGSETFCRVIFIKEESFKSDLHQFLLTFLGNCRHEVSGQRLGCNSLVSISPIGLTIQEANAKLKMYSVPPKKCLLYVSACVEATSVVKLIVFFAGKVI